MLAVGVVPMTEGVGGFNCEVRWCPSYEWTECSSQLGWGFILNPVSVVTRETAKDLKVGTCLFHKFSQSPVYRWSSFVHLHVRPRDPALCHVHY